MPRIYKKKQSQLATVSVNAKDNSSAGNPSKKEQSSETKQTKSGGRKRKNPPGQIESHTGAQTVARQTPDLTQPDFSYNPEFLSLDQQHELINDLNHVPWSKVTYTKFGKPRSTPRHTFCYGTPPGLGASVRVSYMGHDYMSQEMPHWLLTLKERVEKETGFTYNAAILNNYLDPGEYISWHTDDERFLKHTTVASLSLGAARTFKVRRSPFGALCKIKKTKTTPPSSSSSSSSASSAASSLDMGQVQETSVLLSSGSLSVLYHGIEHALPKEKPAPFEGMSNRYNITFRCLKDLKPGEKMSGWGNYYHYNRGSKYEITTSARSEDKKEENEAVQVSGDSNEDEDE